MSCGVEVNLAICPGKTFTKVFRWGQSRRVYKPITAASQAAPCVLTATGHGMPDGWAYQVKGAKGMTQLNTPLDGYRQAIVVDPNTVEINELDATNLDAYEGGGVLSYPMPVDLAGYTARMHIRRNVHDASPVLALTSPTDIVLDNTLKTITVSIGATATAALPEMEGVYDIEMVAAGGQVYLLAYGALIVGTEVTR
jgi:hypothetical protein